MSDQAPDSPDLVARLADAAARAVTRQRRSLEHSEGGAVRGVTVEILLSGSGQIVETVAFIERRSQGGPVMKRPTGA